jgi:phosphoglycerol transferase MdoB-like AlkP superfamily enzyme
MFKKIPASLRFLIQVYLCGIIFFTFLRIILVLFNLKAISEIPFSEIIYSFLIGFRFDTVISGYILAIPLVIFFITSLFRKNLNLINQFVFIFLIIFYSFCLLIICSDIPWFEHQQTRLTVSALQWSNTPGMMLSFIFTDLHNYFFLALLIILIIILFFSLKKLYKINFRKETNFINPFKSVIFYLISFLLIIIATRGRIAFKSPIRWGTAFISNNNFTNQLGLNPVYTLIQSWLDSKNSGSKHLSLIDDAKAISTVQNYLGINNPIKDKSPLLRRIFPSGKPKKYNVIIVLMESMTSYNLKHFGNIENITPELNQLFDSSLSFSNFYSDGIHTFNGIYSSLFGVPSLPNEHHLKDLINQQQYGGLAQSLLNQNYQTIFFTSHDEQFDNLGGFLVSNGYQNIISEKDYDSQKVLNVLGIPDHILFEEVVERIEYLHTDNKSFYATILTSSNHGPYQIPPGIDFKPHSSDIKNQLVEYSDWSIKHFIQLSRQQPWFDSTIFIFTGDHGAYIDAKDVFLTLHHVPLIIYAPRIISPEIKENLGGQVDIFPTVMGILQLPYSNNSFGIDLRNYQREYVTFSYDETYGAFGKMDYWVHSHEKEWHCMIDTDAKNCIEISQPNREDSMALFTRSVFQTHQWMIEKRLINEY